MRRWLSAAFSVAPAALVLAVMTIGCSPSAASLEAPTPTAASARPTQAGPTPNLPVAKAVASPSATVAGAQQTAVAQAFVLHSSAFADGAALPADFSCDGPGQSPPLDWSGAPLLTAAFSLIVQDTDGSNSTNGQPYTSWLLYNMPPNVSQLAAATPPRPLLTNGAQQGLNSNQTVGYAPPCPDKGAAPHHVAFVLFAQDAYVTLETSAALTAVNDALNGHVLAQSQLIATVQR